MVLVTPAAVDLAHSFGWLSKRIERIEIVSAVPLRIPWRYGVETRAAPKGRLCSLWVSIARRGLTDTEEEIGRPNLSDAGGSSEFVARGRLAAIFLDMLSSYRPPS